MTQTQFINCIQCIQGNLVGAPLTIDEHGIIIPNEECKDDALVIDLEHRIIAPGFIELQINGALGFHFANYVDPTHYQGGLQKLSQYLPSTGVTAFYPTVPTVQPDIFQKVLPFLGPFDSSTGASVLVSMGHSAASFEEGYQGKLAGATLLTHTFNAMNPLHHREPGLAGLISDQASPYFSLIADAIHLHPSIVSLAYHSGPEKAILITDSVELSGLPDGLYPGHSQIPHPQLKVGNKVTISGTETLVGTCIPLDQCLRNLIKWACLPIEKAVLTVTENVANAMLLKDRGRLTIGKRGDFVVLNDLGDLLGTWVMGREVWSRDWGSYNHL
ncbi:hypothetical protein EYC80_010190 [Monilinia laxa]|uniref:N-acetylglucosamine-6-phosphate deacetylase n=1 Tax=Monilinia laxa TaxID=61186 RepID=A0A5N6JPY8_MONLA|nr:hypothetical protein EYC80_010190 [Monilinia laxa]